MRYLCIFCAATGASGERNAGPATYNCHVCEERDGMWPEELAKKHLHTVAILRNQGSDVADRLTISRLQTDLNKAKNKLLSQESRHDFSIQSLRQTVILGLKIVDQVMPQAGKIVLDVGAVNDFCMRARPQV